MARFAWQHLDELEHVPDEPYSLYNGVPALCTLFMDLLARQLQQEEEQQERTTTEEAQANPGNTRFPLYDYD